MSELAHEWEPGREAVEAQRVAEGITFRQRLARLERIANDAEVRIGMQALLRTGVNVGISGADVIPGGVGETLSWTADACKRVAIWLNLGALNTSPDVLEKISAGTELIEPFMLGGFQSHLIETTLQLNADWPRMKTAVQKVKDHWNGVQADINKPSVQDALRVFKK